MSHLPKRKTLKHKIHNYISKKQDICCEKYYERKLIIQQIIKKYKHICQLRGEPNEYVSSIHNDLMTFVGVLFDLKKNNDREGEQLWHELDKQMFDNKLKPREIINLLYDVPLYYLLSFLGHASYTESQLSNSKYPN
jgi:hypothetical protein